MIAAYKKKNLLGKASVCLFTQPQQRLKQTVDLDYLVMIKHNLLFM
jgi:hypothetical protein